MSTKLLLFSSLIVIGSTIFGMEDNNNNTAEKTTPKQEINITLPLEENNAQPTNEKDTEDKRSNVKKQMSWERKLNQLTKHELDPNIGIRPERP